MSIKFCDNCNILFVGSAPSKKLDLFIQSESVLRNGKQFRSISLLYLARARCHFAKITHIDPHFTPLGCRDLNNVKPFHPASVMDLLTCKWIERRKKNMWKYKRDEHRTGRVSLFSPNSPQSGWQIKGWIWSIFRIVLLFDFKPSQRVGVVSRGRHFVVWS